MDRRIRILAVLLAACFVLLFAQLNNLQVRQASALQNSRYAPHAAENPFAKPRGEIVTSDGVVIARSTPTDDGYGEQRAYPEGPLFADVTGYYDAVDYADPYGVEATYNDDLEEHEPVANNLRQLLTEQQGTDSLVLTVSDSLQQVAAKALGGLTGAVVAVDPTTGAILAMYSNPTYNPNNLASHDPTTVHHWYDVYADASNPSASPLINGVTAQTYAPGSTFKVVTTAAIYDHDPSLASQSQPDLGALALPETDLQLHNFDGEVCGGPLPQILALSCDTAYAKIGLELGPNALSAEADAFGFDKVPPVDLPSSEVAPANFPPASSFAGNLPFVAYSAIGQKDVTETPLEDALVASAIADGGTIMTPHVLAKVVDSDGQVVDSYAPHPWLQATSDSTAGEVRTLMLGVTSFGTAAGLFPAKLAVAAKTGTAQTGALNCSANWLIATAPAGQNQSPSVAVAAVVPYQAGVPCSGTGAGVAGPVVRTVLLAALGAGQ